MPRIILPDQSELCFAQPVTIHAIAAAIGPRLAASAVAGRVDGQLVDTRHVIANDARVEIIRLQDEPALDLLRHSCAHLLAMAVKSLFPEVQVTIGPVIEDGFYYDFASEHAFTPDDLLQIESRMRALAASDLPIERRELARDEAVALFAAQGEYYKVELINAIPDDQRVSLYRQGGFEDLCRGPHVPSLGWLKAFKLLKVAGAYWRGDARNSMLQRIYGTCWRNESELAAYLQRQEEAVRRDHRKLGARLDLFHFQEDAPGAVFWHPKGWTLFQRLVAHMRAEHEREDYVEVNTPDVMDRSLWEVSGHWQNYREHMFTTETEDGRVFALKPMSCPGAAALFRHGLKSYRDLPIRMAEFGKVHRYEPSGALHGLMRVRHFTQDDAHIFCTLDQLADECSKVVRFVLQLYRQFGFEDVRIKLSTRPDNRIGSDAVWDQLEGALKSVLQDQQLDWQLNPGEGAFYGPKLEFVLRDAIGRDWQCGTLQVDLNLPERFDLNYVAESGDKLRPVMLHRAIFGSLERFIGILIEHCAGNLPVWLAPVQAVVLPISEAQTAYAQAVLQQLKASGIRAEADLRNEKIGFRIREQTLNRVPYLLVVGAREAAQQQLALRSRDGDDLGSLSLADFLQQYAPVLRA
ncbi:threonine--tRNA ligase [Parachitinimonas caeni]|uniref:Threonine--tRNA ligase n=1 Tax=Parachitinimonas caeni TaxID=3031301 RepID=A0ABT7DSI0_9NEIS|nr:threonine--tRNA ligase [Parachitinimonas caeni]MDK2123030.1 threonine--tRNA ligase [Parachitinimonas caeni]